MAASASGALHRLACSCGCAAVTVEMGVTWNGSRRGPESFYWLENAARHQCKEIPRYQGSVELTQVHGFYISSITYFFSTFYSTGHTVS